MNLKNKVKYLGKGLIIQPLFFILIKKTYGNNYVDMLYWKE